MLILRCPTRRGDHYRVVDAGNRYELHHVWGWYLPLMVSREELTQSIQSGYYVPVGTVITTTTQNTRTSKQENE